MKQGSYTIRISAHGDADAPLHLTEITSEVMANLAVDLEFSLPSDVTRDGRVDAADLTFLLASWGSDDEQADLDGNGTTDGADLAMLLSNWD